MPGKLLGMHRGLSIILFRFHPKVNDSAGGNFVIALSHRLNRIGEARRPEAGQMFSAARIMNRSAVLLIRRAVLSTPLHAMIHMDGVKYSVARL